MSGIDVLILAEDPGAVNFLAPLPAAFAAEGIGAAFVADPRLSESLELRDVAFEPLDPACGADDVLRSHQPAVLVTGTSEFADCMGLKTIDAARRAGVPSIAVIDMAANAAGRFRGGGVNPLQHAPDWLAVCDDATGDSFRALGFPENKIVVCGHPHFDWIRDRVRKLARAGRAAARQRHFAAAGDRHVMVFVAESVDRIEPAFSRRSPEYTLHGRGSSDYRTAIVLEEILDAVAAMRPKPYIVLRLHPKNQADEFAAYRGEVDMFSAGGDPVSVVWAADSVVGMTSMLLVEAQILGVPTLSILPRACEKELIVTTANGLTPVATTRADLRRELSALFDRPVRAGCPRETNLLSAGALSRLVGFVKARLAAGPVRCA